MIILKNLEWSNCFSYGENNNISLDNEKITQLVGENGAGKSSIPLILEEVLFNKNSKGVKKADILNRNSSSSKYLINLDFAKEDNNYRIELERGKSISVKVFCNNEDISSHTAINTFKTIESIIGIDFKTFSQIVYQNTKNSLAFLTTTDTERKKFLIDLLNLSTYLDAFEKFKDISKDIASKKISLNSKVDTLEKWIQENSLDGREYQPLIEETIDTEKEESEKALLAEKLKNINQINRKIQENNLNKEALNSIDLSKYSEYKEPQDTKEEKKALLNLQTEKKQANNILSKLKQVENKCPTCLQEVDSDFKNSLEKENKAIIKEKEEKIKELDKVIENKEFINKKVREKRQKQEEFEKLYKSIDNALSEETLEAESLSKELEEIKKKLQEKSNKIKKITQENLKREKNNTQIDLIKEQSRKIENQLTEAYGELQEAEELFNKLEILKKAFSTNGLLAYKIENLVKDLENTANDYLLELSDGRFGIEFIIEKDKLNVYIVDNGNTISISSLSSGELAKVNTATLLAIRKLMNSLSKTQLNVLFLDEVINVLDLPSREKLIEVLSKEDKLNIFLVSHEWTHPLLAKLQVKKTNEMSAIYG